VARNGHARRGEEVEDLLAAARPSQTNSLPRAFRAGTPSQAGETDYASALLACEEVDAAATAAADGGVRPCRAAVNDEQDLDVFWQFYRERLTFIFAVMDYPRPVLQISSSRAVAPMYSSTRSRLR
jgi:hypothetical protein